MSYEEFKQLYCYDINKIQFEMYERLFKMKYNYKNGLIKYPNETDQMKYEKFKFIYEKHQEYLQIIIPKTTEPRDHKKEIEEFLIVWLSSLNKKGLL